MMSSCVHLVVTCDLGSTNELVEGELQFIIHIVGSP